ncbi:DUF4364 family protein [Haloimpatiens lingqiaonensis]|uniref:DUF4364 family protein n=1 Tax=Haloimpatiens lingqiaonensis TaxID=1380675 RepID=UPI0010FD22A6|nr:DUF4364 family protein [Haloimpatiens lingqiaonensis]
MFDDTLELAENKLLLLYILEKIHLPISNMQLTNIVLENNFMNYFSLQQYLSELLSSKFIEETEKDNKHRLNVTEKGSKVLSLFQKRISVEKISSIDEYLQKQMRDIKKELTITADYTIENSDNFIVNLKASESDYTLIDIKIGVPSNKQARELCSKWKTHSSTLYNKIMDLLINEEI